MRSGSRKSLQWNYSSKHLDTHQYAYNEWFTNEQIDRKLYFANGIAFGRKTLFSKRNFNPMSFVFVFYKRITEVFLDISNEAMLASEKGLNRLLEGVKLVKNIQPSTTSSFSVNELDSELL